MTSTLTLGSVASLLAATFYADRNHKVRNIVSTEIYTPYAGANGILLHINKMGSSQWENWTEFFFLHARSMIHVFSVHNACVSAPPFGETRSYFYPQDTH